MSETRGPNATPLVLRFVGEFAVIVLGVLVALGVDAWSEDRDAESRELDLLQSLETDLRGSLEVLNRDNDSTLARVATLDWALRFPVDSRVPFPVDSLIPVSSAANITAAYYPTLRTYETMIATGTFDLISNPDVRLALADVKSQTQVYTDYRVQATQQWNDTYSVTWLQHMGVHRLDGVFGPKPLPNPPPPGAMEDALRDDFFRAVIDRRRIFLFFVAEYGKALATTLERALELIEADLAARE
jgi:hypothetical protein